MAKEIKINIRLITDGKEQGCDLLKIHLRAIKQFTNIVF